MRARVPVGALVGLVMLGLVGCGGGGSHRAQSAKWARAFCLAFGDYERDIADRGSRLSRELRAIPATDLAAGRKALVSFLSDSVDRSDRFLRALGDAGAPDVKDGSAIARTIADGFGELRSTFVDAERDARKVSTGDPASFSERVTAINDAIRIGSDRSRETITRARVRYETRELDRAFNQASACKRIA